jgi:hypothetical protein
MKKPRNHWQRDREMAPAELAGFMQRHRLPQTEMMAYLDIGERTLRRYLRGTAPIPVPIVLILRALDELREPPDIP